MARSSLDTVVTQAASDQDLGHQDSPTSGSRRSDEPEVPTGSILVQDGTRSSNSDVPDHGLLASNISCTSVPETPGTSLASISSCLSISRYNPRVGGGIRNAVPARGTPLAIGALKLHKHPSVFLHAITPFRKSVPYPDSPRILQRTDTVQVSSIRFV